MSAVAQPSLFDVQQSPAFAGPEYTPALDRERLTKQYDAILEFTLAQSDWLVLEELVAGLRRRYPHIGFPENSVQAQLRHIRAAGYQVSKRRRGGLTTGLYEWRVTK